MKKVIAFILIFVCIVVLIFGCSKANSSDTSLHFSFDKNGNYEGFSDLPLNYTIKDAKDDGYFVTQNLEFIANEKVWDNFVEASLRRENTGVRCIKFYTETTESPYFLDLFYEDGYYYLFDSTSENQQKQPYLYLLTLEGKFGNPLKDSGVIVLTDDDTLTFEKVMSAMLSSSTVYIKSVSPFKLVMFI